MQVQAQPALPAQAPSPVPAEGKLQPGQMQKQEGDPQNLDGQLSREEYLKRWGTLTKKERQNVETMRQLQEREAKLKADSEALEIYRRFKADPHSNPMELLQHFGLDYKTLTDYILAADQGPSSPEDEIASLKQMILEDRENRNKEKLTAEEQRQEQIFDSVKSGIHEFVESSGEKYEFIRSSEAVETVFDVMREYWQENNEILPIEDACDYVEQYLEKEAEERILKLTKVKKKFQSPIDSNPQQAPLAEKKPSFTLTNSMAGSSSSPEAAFSSREERLKAAVSRLRFTN